MNPTTAYILLTHYCPQRCPHCFMNAGTHVEPRVMPVPLLRRLLRELHRMPSIQRVIFAGGEPFMFYQHLRLAVHDAAILDLKPAVWTSGLVFQDAVACSSYVKGLVEVGLETLVLSVDPFHPVSFPQERIEQLSQKLGPASLVMATVTSKNTEEEPDFSRNGGPWLDGPIAYGGRASRLVETEGQALWGPESFTACPHRNLEEPDAIYIDSWGFIHVCPGIFIGNVSRRSLRDVLKSYSPHRHPIIAPILREGPFGLAREYGVQLADGYADACHLCYRIRKELAERKIPFLGPSPYYEDER